MVLSNHIIYYLCCLCCHCRKRFSLIGQFTWIWCFLYRLLSKVTMHFLLLCIKLIVHISIIHSHNCFVGGIIACYKKSQSLSRPSHSNCSDGFTLIWLKLYFLSVIAIGWVKKMNNYFLSCLICGNNICEHIWIDICL